MSTLLETVVSAARAPFTLASALEGALEQRQFDINDYVANNVRRGNAYSFSEVREKLIGSGMVSNPFAYFITPFYLGFGLGGRQPLNSRDFLEIKPVFSHGLKFRIREYLYRIDPTPPYSKGN